MAGKGEAKRAVAIQVRRTGNPAAAVGKTHLSAERLSFGNSKANQLAAVDQTGNIFCRNHHHVGHTYDASGRVPASMELGRRATGSATKAELQGFPIFPHAIVPSICKPSSFCHGHSAWPCRRTAQPRSMDKTPGQASEQLEASRVATDFRGRMRREPLRRDRGRQKDDPRFSDAESRLPAI